MYQVINNSATIKFSDEEKEIFNQEAILLQTTENTTFTNSKQVVFALISRCKQLENQKTDLENQLETVKTNLESLETNPKTDENKLETSEIKQELIKVIGFDETVSDEDLLQACLHIFERADHFVVEIAKELNLPTATHDQILEAVKEKIQTPTEVVKEVERALTENEVLLNLSAQQKQTIEIIARWRSRTGKDSQLNTIEQTIKRMVFNSGTLMNDHGQFDTPDWNNKEMIKNLM